MAEIATTLITILGPIAAQLIPKLFDKLSDEPDADKRKDEIKSSLVEEMLKAGKTIKAKDLNNLINVIDKKFVESRQIPHTVGIGQMCGSHGDCGKAGFAEGQGASLLDDVACCEDKMGIKRCQFKKKDYLGVPWCPGECRGSLFGAQGTCSKTTHSEDMYKQSKEEYDQMKELEKGQIKLDKMKEKEQEKMKLNRKRMTAQDTLKLLSDVDKMHIRNDNVGNPDAYLGSLQYDYPKTTNEIEGTMTSLERNDDFNKVPKIKMDSEDKKEMGLVDNIKDKMFQLVDLSKKNIRKQQDVKYINPIVEPSLQKVDVI